MRTSTIKSIAALALTGAGSALVLGFQTTDVASSGRTTLTSAAAGVIPQPAPSSTSGLVGSATTTDGGTATAAPATGTAVTAAYADGTWTGQAVEEPWGPFQVQVVVSNGSIVNVKVVESPADRHSSRINTQAVPILTEATVASQAATVDVVSGATWTSESYAASLQSALDEAAAAA
jgi:uncharacterized protein with FMN-binding domain